MLYLIHLEGFWRSILFLSVSLLFRYLMWLWFSAVALRESKFGTPSIFVHIQAPSGIIASTVSPIQPCNIVVVNTLLLISCIGLEAISLVIHIPSWCLFPWSSFFFPFFDTIYLIVYLFTPVCLIEAICQMQHWLCSFSLNFLHSSYGWLAFCKSIHCTYTFRCFHTNNDSQ